MQFQKNATQYINIAASATTVPVGNVGAYLESITVVPASSAATTVVLADGSTTIISIPTNAGTGTGTACPQPYTLQLGLRATSPTTCFKITTGAAISVIAVGRFTIP